MPQKNMEIAEKAVAALNETYRTGDMTLWRRTVEETCDPDITLDSDEAFTEGAWHGHDGVVGFVANQMEVLAHMWLRIDECLYIDRDWLVLAITFGGAARHTGIPVELHAFHVFRFRDGKSIRWRIFLDRDKALGAVGLAGQDAQPGS